jgi:hypothetical protein
VACRYAHRQGGSTSHVTAVIINLGAKAATVPIAIRGAAAVQGAAAAATTHQLYTISAWPSATNMQVRAGSATTSRVHLRGHLQSVIGC